MDNDKRRRVAECIAHAAREMEEIDALICGECDARTLAKFEKRIDTIRDKLYNLQYDILIELHQ